MTKDTTITRPPLTPSTSSSCFLGCFGKKTRLKEEVNSGNRRRGRSWISSFRLKKSLTKTVPVDLTRVNDAPTTTSDASWDIQVVEENATLAEKRTMIVNRKHALITSGEQKARQNKLTTGGQKETKLAATSAHGPGCASQPGTKTLMITHPFVSSPLKPLTHSKPLPPTKWQKPPHAAHAASGRGRGVPRRTPPLGREFDSIIGLSIILVILVVLVLWGKLCAILCTSSWFFIVRRLVAAKEHSAMDKPPPEAHNKMDLESEEYKKKVILEGLLQRNHRKMSVGRL